VLVEEAVLKWYSQQQSSGLGVHVVQLKAAVETFAKHFKLHNFTCSSGWLWQFRQRHNITNLNICGDVESVEPFRKKMK
jgi:hypothetical protein